MSAANEAMRSFEYHLRHGNALMADLAAEVTRRFINEHPEAASLGDDPCWHRLRERHAALDAALARTQWPRAPNRDAHAAELVTSYWAEARRRLALDLSLHAQECFQ